MSFHRKLMVGATGLSLRQVEGNGKRIERHGRAPVKGTPRTDLGARAGSQSGTCDSVRLVHAWANHTRVSSGHPPAPRAVQQRSLRTRQAAVFQGRVLDVVAHRFYNGLARRRRRSLGAGANVCDAIARQDSVSGVANSTESRAESVIRCVGSSTYSLILCPRAAGAPSREYVL